MKISSTLKIKYIKQNRFKKLNHSIMDWRKKLYADFISESVLSDLLSEVSEKFNENNPTISKISNQIGTGFSPNQATFEWRELTRSQKKTFRKHSRNSQNICFEVKHNFGKFTDLFDIEKNIDELYERFMKEQIKKYSGNDLISVNIFHDELVGRPLFIPPTKKKNFDPEAFFNAIYCISQSKQSLLLNGKLTFEINITEEVRGSGKTKAPITLQDKELQSRSVIQVNNNDKGCAFHAIIISIFKLNFKSEAYKWQCIRRNTNSARVKEAKKLAEKCGFDLNHQITISDFEIIQAHLDQYQLIVIDAKNKFNRLFVGSVYRPTKIYIKCDKDDEHFDSIINICGYMGQKFYCEHCHKPYSHRYTHKCAFLCPHCFKFPPCPEDPIRINCQKCNIDFNGKSCYDNHLIDKNSVCRNVKKCGNCLTVFKGSHECDLKKCCTCGEKYKLVHHFCYLKTMNMDKIAEQDRIEKVIVAYDIECQQNLINENIYRHDPDLLISKTACDRCWNFNENSKIIQNCDLCGEAKKVFKDKDCIKRFGDYIYKDLAVKAAKNGCIVYIFAHNAKGYDNHFIINDLFQRKFIDTSVIMSGTKVMKASVGNIKFLDSLLMFQQPLASLPKAFGLENSVKKGFFPHLYHNRENFENKLSVKLPEEKFFGVNLMKSKQLKEFRLWYSEEKLRTEIEGYYLENELIKYCENDVDILLSCLQMFRKIYKNVTNIDPITRCFTLASMGLEIFKAKILPKNVIGVTPIKGYGKRGSFSRIGNCWLDFQQKLINCEINREISIDNYIVDGFHAGSNTIYEYNGCYFHCHHCVYPERRNQCITFKNGRISEKTPEQIYEYTLKKKEHLTQKRKFNLIEEWDCSLSKKRKEDDVLDKYIEKRWKQYSLIDMYGGVDVRESFFGGRTNNIKFHCDVSHDENKRILYYDFRSLYPTVLKYKLFPVGHPKVINENLEDNEISNYFGFIKCILKPPKNLRIPVLPIKNKNKKLIFPLCTKCAEDLNPTNCNHSESERNLIGTWTTVEISYALKSGYEIVKLIEVYHYEETTKEIFSEYINLWLKYKQQSDGWPSWVKDDSDKCLYIQKFFENEQVSLNDDEILKNPALRFIAKLFLNTLWGKLAQRPNLPQTTICNEYHEYWKLANDEDKLIKGELMVNEDTLLVTWEYKDDELGRTGNTSLAIASFVTSYARIELMKVIDEVEKIPGRLLYMDTDSIIFEYKDGDPKPETDDYLGCLCDEISKDYGENAVCTKFCSLGPKVYALEIWPENSSEPIVPIKAKGITLTDNSLDIIKMESMVKLAESYIINNGHDSDKLMIEQMQIKADRMHSIETRYFEKTFRVMSEKRRIFGNDTLPYGYID